MKAARTFVTIVAVGMALLGRSMHLCACDATPVHCSPASSSTPASMDDLCCSDGSCSDHGGALDDHHGPADEHHHATDDHGHATGDDHDDHGVAAVRECGGHGSTPSPDPALTAPCSCPTLDLPNSPAEVASTGRLVSDPAPTLVIGHDAVCATVWAPAGEQAGRVAQRPSFRPPGPLRRHLELSVLRC